MGWSKLKISEFCKTGSGGTPSRYNNKYYTGAIPWVKSGELNDNYIFDTEEKINELAVKESSAKIVKKGAILIALYGATVGKTAILETDAATNQAVCYILPDNSIAETKFVWYALRNKLNEFLSKRIGGAQPNISQEIVRNTELLLPPKAEQLKIIKILEQSDNILKRKRETVNLIEKIIISQFFNIFGHPIINDFNWKTSLMKDVINLHYGQSLSSENRINGEYPVYGSNGIVGFHDEHIVEYDTIIIGRKGSAGSINLVRGKSFPIDTTFFVEIKKELKIEFLYCFLKIINLNKLAIVTGVPGINRDDIYKQQIYLPPLNLQHEFVVFFKTCKEIQKNIDITNVKIINLFKNLLYKGMSGKLTIDL